MASIKFVVSDDRPEALSFKGDGTELLALTSYMIGKLYAALKRTDSDTAEAYRTLLSKAIADPEGPVWNVEPHVGETVVAFTISKEEDD